MPAFIERIGVIHENATLFGRPLTFDVTDLSPVGNSSQKRSKVCAHETDDDQVVLITRSIRLSAASFRT